MKKYLYALALVASAAAVALALYISNDVPALNVNDVASDPAAFSGTLTVAGVMGAVSQQDPTVIGVMDLKELACTTPGCNKVYLPVRYQGPQPAIGDEVRVTGRFVNQGQFYLFVADQLQVVRNHKIGG